MQKIYDISLFVYPFNTYRHIELKKNYKQCFTRFKNKLVL